MSDPQTPATATLASAASTSTTPASARARAAPTRFEPAGTDRSPAARQAGKRRRLEAGLQLAHAADQLLRNAFTWHPLSFGGATAVVLTHAAPGWDPAPALALAPLGSCVPRLHAYAAQPDEPVAQPRRAADTAGCPHFLCPRLFVLVALPCSLSGPLAHLHPPLATPLAPTPTQPRG